MQSLPRPAALLFDIGGTILRENSYDLAAGLRALEPRHDAAELLGNLQESIDNVHDSVSAEFTLARWLTDNRESFAKHGSILELELALWEATARLEPMPGVAQALRMLADAGLALGCISNAVFSGPVLKSELKRHALANAFAFVLSSADLEIRKPDPRIFWAGLSKVDVSASSAWFVGDSWSADIQGAAAAGLFPVWLSSLEGPTPSDSYCARVGSWPELCSLVANSLAA
jgi:putative hydrolase of the HAD superfamily